MVRISSDVYRLNLLLLWCYWAFANPLDSRQSGAQLRFTGENERLIRKRGLKKFHRSRHSVAENSMLTESLQLRRDQACEGQRLSLKCPAHTQLVIESTFFGRSVPYSELCPPQHQAQYGGKKDNPESLATSSSHILWQERYEDLSCDVSNAHSKVMEVCQYRRKCKINANSRFFGRDPCPMTAKYLQISYKCKPSRFGSENFCEGTTMQLGCKPNQRLAIYAANYGGTVANSPAECLGGTPVPYDCTIDVLHVIMRVCHAQSKCSASVNDVELGSPRCPENVNKYLNIIFICVNEEVFSDSALTGQWGSDESSYEFPAVWASAPPDRTASTPTTLSTQNDASIDFGEGQHPRSFIPAMNSDENANGALPNRSIDARQLDSVEAEKSELGSSPAPTTRCLPESVPNAVVQVQNWLSAYEYIHKNQEKFFLYFGLSSSTGIIALLLFCIVQLCWRYRGRSIDNGSQLNDKYSASRASSKLEVTSAHTPTVCDEGRVEMTDFGRDGISFLRFNHPTPPRNHAHGTTPAVSIAAATSSYPSHQFYS